MENNTGFPLTVYGLLARRWDTSVIYVGQIARGERKAIRGKGLKIYKELRMLESSLDDWFCHILNDGAMRFEMPNKVNVYIQHEIASVYKGGDLLYEKDVKDMNLTGLKDWLNVVRIENN
ncbi:MAG: hypothetical protein LBU84_15330 [Prevotella sp.]|jgi:hypothetical protein|nr:hypothetical protein [Prevotella sp.]